MIATTTAEIRERDHRPTWSGGMLAAVVATLEQPWGWALALAGFLARGGVLLFLLPIVALPTPAGLQARLAPVFAPLVLGTPSEGLIALLAGLALAAAGLLFLGTWIGAWTESVLVRSVAAGLLDADERSVAPRGRRSFDVAAARLLAHVPLAIALGAGALRIGETAYREMVTPFEVATPLVLRVLGGAPDAIAAIAVTWLLGEAAGAVAAREIVLGGRGVAGAVLHGWIRLARRPLGSLATALATTLLVALAVLPGLVAAWTAWRGLRGALYDGRTEEVVLGLVLFVSIWLGSLVLAAVAAAARSAAWTAEWLRHRRVPFGTIGESLEPDRGGWPGRDPSGTL